MKQKDQRHRLLTTDHKLSWQCMKCGWTMHADYPGLMCPKCRANWMTFVGKEE